MAGIADLCQGLALVADWLAIPNVPVILRQTQAQGGVIPGQYQRVTVPKGVRFWQLTNLSATTLLLYWYTTDPSPPPNAYRTLGQSATVSKDTTLPVLTLLPAAGATDAGWEIEFWVYDPTKPSALA